MLIFRTYKELKEITMEVARTGQKKYHVLVLPKRRKDPIARAVKNAKNFLALFQ